MRARPMKGEPAVSEIPWPLAGLEKSPQVVDSFTRAVERDAERSRDKESHN
jgi:hypothetical protein